jgi:hypothetical protein
MQILFLIGSGLLGPDRMESHEPHSSPWRKRESAASGGDARSGELLRDRDWSDRGGLPRRGSRLLNHFGPPFEAEVAGVQHRGRRHGQQEEHEQGYRGK